MTFIGRKHNRKENVRFLENVPLISATKCCCIMYENPEIIFVLPSGASPTEGILHVQVKAVAVWFRGQPVKVAGVLEVPRYVILAIIDPSIIAN